MDLTGIENEAEFFPAGTLSEVLKDELKDITGRWAGLDKSAHPVDRLVAIAEPVLNALRQARQTHDRERQRRLVAEMHHTLITALGYTRSPNLAPSALESAALIPRAGRAADADGRDVLWILETPFQSVDDEASDPLGLCFSKEQAAGEDAEHLLTERNLEDLLAEGIFALPDGPRFVLVLGGAQLVLIDQRKWPARSVLRFDLQEIFSRADRDTLTVMACLLAREARVPDQGVPLSDRLEEEAQRNANAVTTSLKRTVRDAIEILGQEVLEVTDGKYPGNYPEPSRRGVWIDGDSLSFECLRYMYRLLFLFYAEANPRLGLLDLKDEIYASGYSLEALRELESKRLRTPAERNGTFLWESLQRTLTLLYSGDGAALELPAVKVALLDPASTPLLNALRLRNEAIQKVIRLLSLRSSRKGTGRISYAKLGIGQLGAVYETLISFTGVVAKTDLIELKLPKERAAASNNSEDDELEGEVDSELLDYEEEEETGETRHDKVDKLAPSWFVPRSRIDEFRPEEIVFDGREARIYPKGSFLYRLAGRDREKTASFYTPEPLARLLVKHALMERCRDLSADEILDLKVLEPAMGSAAFLVETVNQLADIYLERKQKELGQTIPQESVVLEKQKVRAFIADRNCFGVDYNPVAVELGAISLWLNSLHASDFSPWFGDQLHAGNSLIGARRASYSPELLTASKQADLWLNHSPEEIGWRRQLPDGHVWQWLLPAKDMAAFEKDKSIRAFAGEDQERIKAWRKAGFFKKLELHEMKLAQRLSRVAEGLFEQVADDLAKTRASANDAITLWPDKVMPGNEGLDFRGKAQLKARLIGDDHASNTLPYKRLKTAMDAWCALWLWPLDKAECLPSRVEFLQGMAMLLEGGFTPDGSLAAASIDEFQDPFPDLFDQLDEDAPARDLFAGEKGQSGLFNETNVEALIDSFEWLGIATEVAAQERFMHFDLVFADVMRERGGFDLIVGNPPWEKPMWSDSEMLAEVDPKFAVRKLTSAIALKEKAMALDTPSKRNQYLREYATKRGQMAFSSARINAPFSGAGAKNLYRSFFDLSIRCIAPVGIVGLIHQDGHLGTVSSSVMRENWYKRIVKHFEFSNQITKKNFSEVLHTKRFSVNIYRGVSQNVKFLQFTNAFLPAQVDESFSHDGSGPVPGVKADGYWDVRPHAKRLFTVDTSFLKSSLELLGAFTSRPTQAPFLQVLTEEQADTIKRISSNPKLHQGVASKILSSSIMLVQDQAEKAGLIKRVTSKNEKSRYNILSGPMMYPNVPLYKIPRDVCLVPQHYDIITELRDLNLSEARQPFLIYNDEGVTKALEKEEAGRGYRPLGEYKLCVKRRVDPGGERTLVSAIFPRDWIHVDQINSVFFSDYRALCNAAGLWGSLLYDFWIRCTRQSDVRPSTLESLPWVDLPDEALWRVLALNYAGKRYRQLFTSTLPAGRNIRSAKYLLPINSSVLRGEVPSLESELGLKTWFDRRIAAIELDVLVARALGLPLEEFLQITLSFPVLLQNEKGTYYDQLGQIVYSQASDFSKVGFLTDEGKRPNAVAWQKILEQNPDELVCTAIDDTMPGGPQQVERRFRGPFTTCDRVEDYRRAWDHFERLSSGGVA